MLSLRCFPRLAVLCPVVCVFAVVSGCSLRTPALLGYLNQPSAAAPPPVDVQTRVAQLTREQLADSYVHPTVAAAWLRALGAQPAALLRLHGCLVSRVAPDACVGAFPDGALGGAYPPWGLPGPVRVIQLAKEATATGGELDVERFLGNARLLGATLSTLSLVRGETVPDEVLAAGLKQGTEEAARYVEARTWHRDLKRPTTAIVMSGGAANGAFSAGVVWRLMEVLQKCKGAAAGGCPDAHVDLAVGTSTGALIGTTLDEFSTPGRECTAEQLLMHSYTCSVESDLLCVQDAWDWKLAQNLKGLVRFDGVQCLLEKTLTSDEERNSMELVTVSVDLERGDVHAESDQDPGDQGPPGVGKAASTRRIQSILASIVEPVLAQPVDPLPAKGGGTVRGTFSDGGLRSGLPLLEAMRRGAERVLVLATGRLEPDPIAPPASALSILSRTIDLVTAQIPISEVQLGGAVALARRWAEYNVCRARYPTGKAQDFCTRKPEALTPQPPLRPQVALAGWTGPTEFPEVSSSWRATWVFRPDVNVKTASGYQFDPEVMRGLFVTGVRTFQRRCPEILDTLGVTGDLAAQSCSEDTEAVVARVNGLIASRCVLNKATTRTCSSAPVQCAIPQCGPKQ